MNKSTKNTKKIRSGLLLFFLICISARIQAQALLQATGSANAFSVTYPANITSVNAGLMLTFQSNQGVSGASTLNLNGLGPIAIKKNYDQDVQANDIKNGHFVTVIYDGTYWQMLTSAANPTGNIAGTGTATGVAYFSNNSTLTADGANFSFIKANNTALNIGKITIRSTSSSGDNLTIGANAGNINITGNSNTMYGEYTGTALTSGSENSFFGSAAGKSVAGGQYNAFFGSGAGYNNVTGFSNTAIGSDAGYNTTSSDNVFVGRRAGLTNNFGTKNVAIGSGADMASNNLINAIAIGYNATVGGNNAMALGGTGANAIKVGIGTGIPAATLHVVGNAEIDNLSLSGAVFADNTGKLYVSTTTGASLWTLSGTNIQPTSTYDIRLTTVSGGFKIENNYVLRANSGGSVYVGSGAGNTSSTSNSNYFFGNNAGGAITSGFGNSFIGTQAGQVATTGQDNNFFGRNAGFNHTTGYWNVFLGYWAGAQNTIGSGNIAIGYQSDMANNSLNNAIAIGWGATVGGSNMMSLGAPAGSGNSLKVGIGTTIPTSVLHVVGDARIENLSLSGAVFADNLGKLYVSTSSGANAWTINGVNIIPQAMTNNLAIGTTTTGLNAGSTRYFTLASDIGYAAGTSSSLEMKGSTNAFDTPFARLDFFNTNTPVPTTTNSARIQILSGKTGTTQGNGQIVFSTYNTSALTEIMRITHNAVGIAVNPSFAELEVGGGVNNTYAMFGSGLKGVSVYGLNDPTIGLNQYEGAASNLYSMSTGRTAEFRYDAAADALKINISNGLAGSAGTVMTMTQRLILTNDGRLGLGSFASPLGRAEIRGINPKATTAPVERIAVFTSGDAASPMELRLSLKTHATPSNRYAEIEAFDAGPVNLMLQPMGGNVSIGTTVAGNKFNVVDISTIVGASAINASNNVATSTRVNAVFGTVSSSASDAAGVRGENTSASGDVAGVYGKTVSLTAFAAGVFGLSGGTSGQTFGVYGRNNGNGQYSAGVRGFQGSTTGEVYGVQGVVSSTDPMSAAIVGTLNASNGFAGMFMGKTYISTALGIGTTLVGNNVQLAIKDGHLQSQQTTAPIANVSIAGTSTGGTCTLSNGTDIAGKINLTMGAGTPVAGIQCRINFNKSFVTPPIVSLTPANQLTIQNLVLRQIHVFNITSSSMDIVFGAAATASQAYQFNYIIIETQ